MFWIAAVAGNKDGQCVKFFDLKLYYFFFDK